MIWSDWLNWRWWLFFCTCTLSWASCNGLRFFWLSVKRVASFTVLQSFRLGFAVAYASRHPVRPGPATDKMNSTWAPNSQRRSLLSHAVASSYLSHPVPINLKDHWKDAEKISNVMHISVVSSPRFDLTIGSCDWDSSLKTRGLCMEPVEFLTFRTLAIPFLTSHISHWRYVSPFGAKMSLGKKR